MCLKQEHSHPASPTRVPCHNSVLALQHQVQPVGAIFSGARVAAAAEHSQEASVYAIPCHWPAAGSSREG